VRAQNLVEILQYARMTHGCKAKTVSDTRPYGLARCGVVHRWMQGGEGAEKRTFLHHGAGEGSREDGQDDEGELERQHSWLGWLMCTSYCIKSVKTNARRLFFIAGSKKSFSHFPGAMSYTRQPQRQAMSLRLRLSSSFVFHVDPS